MFQNLKLNKVMKNNKKILIALSSIGLVCAISYIVGWSISMLFGVSILAGFVLITVLQLVGWKLWTSYMDYQMIDQTLKQLAEKKYKDYVINLPCQHCATMQAITIDLHDNEFICQHCSKPNAVITNITTAAIIPELDKQEIFNRLQKI
jgi:hypothetical protein